MKREWRLALFYGITVCMVVLTAKLASSAVSVMAENKPFEREHCIIIDPGHGGEDGGAISISNLPESGYNLAISLHQ